MITPDRLARNRTGAGGANAEQQRNYRPARRSPAAAGVVAVQVGRVGEQGREAVTRPAERNPVPTGSSAAGPHPLRQRQCSWLPYGESARTILLVRILILARWCQHKSHAVAGDAPRQHTATLDSVAAMTRDRAGVRLAYWPRSPAAAGPVQQAAAADGFLRLKEAASLRFGTPTRHPRICSATEAELIGYGHFTWRPVPWSCTRGHEDSAWARPSETMSSQRTALRLGHSPTPAAQALDRGWDSIRAAAVDHDRSLPNRSRWSSPGRADHRPSSRAGRVRLAIGERPAFASHRSGQPDSARSGGADAGTWFDRGFSTG